MKNKLLVLKISVIFVIFVTMIYIILYKHVNVVNMLGNVILTKSLMNYLDSIKQIPRKLCRLWFIFPIFFVVFILIIYVNHFPFHPSISPPTKKSRLSQDLDAEFAELLGDDDDDLLNSDFTSGTTTTATTSSTSRSNFSTSVAAAAPSEDIDDLLADIDDLLA